MPSEPRDRDGTPSTADRPPGVLWPGLLIGIGLGGFVDGILLHQVLQWHHMLTNTPDDTIGLAEYPATTVAGLEANTLADGFFHVATWIFVVVGIAMLWRVATSRHGPWSHSSLLGAILAGWGTFNLVEGVVDHHLLQIHHVRMAEDVEIVLLWDLGFLAVGAAMLAVGLWLHRRGRDRMTATPSADGSAAGATGTGGTA